MRKLRMEFLRSSLNRLAPANMSAALLLSGVALVAAFVPPKANAANLILNGGFEGGVQSVTMNGFTNNNVPIDWTPNAVFVQFSASNGVVSNPVHSGIAALSMAIPDTQPPPTLSQTFADVAGAIYTVTFFYEGVAPPVLPGDPTATLAVSIVGILSKFATGVPTNGFVTSTFMFAGSGTDTLVFSAVTNAGVWIVDDVSVIGPGVPEPATWVMMLIGFAGLGFAFRQSRRKVMMA
jgi:PEP-CTERM motif